MRRAGRARRTCELCGIDRRNALRKIGKRFVARDEVRVDPLALCIERAAVAQKRRFVLGQRGGLARHVSKTIARCRSGCKVTLTMGTLPHGLPLH